MALSRGRGRSASSVSAEIGDGRRETRADGPGSAIAGHTPAVAGPRAAGGRGAAADSSESLASLTRHEAKDTGSEITWNLKKPSLKPELRCKERSRERTGQMGDAGSIGFSYRQVRV